MTENLGVNGACKRVMAVLSMGCPLHYLFGLKGYKGAMFKEIFKPASWEVIKYFNTRFCWTVYIYIHHSLGQENQFEMQYRSIWDKKNLWRQIKTTNEK